MRGKRLFNAACASCHVGGGTRTNQNHGFIGAPRVCMQRNDESKVFGWCSGTSAWPSRSSAARSPTVPPSKARSLGSRQVPWCSFSRPVDLLLTSAVLSSGLVDYLNNPTTYDGAVLSVCESHERGN